MADPLFSRADWKTARQYWMSNDAPCARCGQPIDRLAPAGHPASLDVGHVVSRHQARQMGWTPGEINALVNTQPEHATCNRAAGARMGNRLRLAQEPCSPITSRRW